MLATGLLLVPIGIALMGLALRGSDLYGRWLSWIAIILGLVGTIGAAIEVVDTDSDLSALGVLAMVVFHLLVGWQTMTLSTKKKFDLPHDTH